MTKKFKDFVTTNNLNLSIEHGELSALLGVNGARKTITTKRLSGLLVLFPIVLSNIVLFNYISVNLPPVHSDKVPTGEGKPEVLENVKEVRTDQGT